MAETRTLPEVEEAAPGLWRIPLPIPDSPLPWVTVHALAVDDGVVLVDTGWPLPEVYELLLDRLAAIGSSIADVRGLVATHIHPDHYGLARRIKDETGAWIAMHKDEAAMIRSGESEVDRAVAALRRWLAQVGAPPLEQKELDRTRFAFRRYMDVARPDRLVEDGERIELDGWTLRAIATPGHSPGHLCFELEGRSILLTGDHVLPRISPNVSYLPGSGPDPLGRYLASLDRLRGLEVDLALPCHGDDRVDLETRIDELAAHHDERLDEARDIVADGAETIYEIAAGMDWSIPWGEHNGFVRRSAVGEAYAHVILLERRGVLARRGEQPYRWQLL